MKRLKYAVLGILASGNVGMGWTSNHYISNQTTVISGPDLTGNDYGIVMVNNSDVTNNSAISADTSGIFSNGSNLTNNASIISQQHGIEASDSVVINNTTGTITGETGFLLINSGLKNYGNIIVLNGGMGVNASETSVENYGDISGDAHGFVINQTVGNTKTFYNEGIVNVTGIALNIINYTDAVNNGRLYGQNTGLYSLNNTFLNDSSGEIKSDNMGANIAFSNLVNKGSIQGNKIGIYSEKSSIINENYIQSPLTGVVSNDGVYFENKGKIESLDTGVKITSGSNQYSGHFKNSGIIDSSNNAVLFNGADNVLELSGGSDIKGKIDGGSGENILIVNGNISLNNSEVNNFNKLIVSGDTVIDGVINLNPSVNNDYYTQSFSNVKDLSQISSETHVGKLTVKGTVNIGVDYDNISSETDKTGKIITNSLTMLNGGKVVLINKGGTTDNLITEAQKSGEKDRISIKSIIISNKQQAVNPDFKFSVSSELETLDGWKRDTVSRIENGVTVMDEIYTKESKSSDPPTNQPDPDVKPGQEYGKINSVPRNRVDLDNLNKLDNYVKRVMQTGTADMKPGDHKFSLEYSGTKFNSEFNAKNNYNYDYDVNSNGIAGSFIYKQSENLYAGFALSYSNNDVKYENNDSEDIESVNAGIFGKYTKNNWDLGARLGYGHNYHETAFDWMGLGTADSYYDSNVFKAGFDAVYNKTIFEDRLNLRPGIGIDYTRVYEGKIRTDGMSDISSASGEGFTGILGIGIGNSQNNTLKWNAGINYSYNFTDTFHEERNMSNGYKMEKLHYARDSFDAYIDFDVKVSEKFSIQAGYTYEYNENYENHNIKTGISYILK